MRVLRAAFVVLTMLWFAAPVASASPVINSITPASGPVGSGIAIAGSGFGATQGSSTVSLNGISAVVTSWSDTAVYVVAPSGASSGPFSLTAGGQTATSSNFSVTPLPSGWSQGDIGSVGSAGSGTFANGAFTVQGAGIQVYSSSDAFHFVYQPLSGDGSIVARLVSMSSSTGDAVAGVMIRETLNANATNAKTANWPHFGQICFDIRTTTGGTTTEPGCPNGGAPYWLKLVRSGNSFSSYMAADGVNWTQIGSSQTISMAQNVYIGLAVDSGSSSLATAVFDSVSVSSTSSPAPTVTSPSATTGPIGGQVTLNGSGFGASQGPGVVLLSAAPMTINSWSDTAIVFTIPAGAASGPLLVNAGSTMNASNSSYFTITSNPLPSGWLDADVGPTGVIGSATYSNGIFTVNGAGVQVYSTADAFHFVYQPLSGDGNIVARLVSMTGGSADAVAGVMIRETLQKGSTNVKTAYWYHFGQLCFDVRSTTGGTTTEPGCPNGAPAYWLKIARSGNSFTSYIGPDGANWTQIAGAQTITMAQNVYIGLAVDSGTTSATATATFDNIYVNNVPVYSPPPSISSISPTSGEPGTTVTISGSNFGGRTGTVTFNGQQATVSSWSASSIAATVPNGASSGNVVVNTGVAQTNGVAFTVLVPTISGISPQTGPSGTSVTVSGSNFGASAGTVTFNGQTATTSAWADSSITAAVPSSATSGNVVVTNGGLSSNGISFTVTPGITGLSPTSGDPGVSVVISGSHFGSSPGSGGGVTFNGTTAGISSWSDGSITAAVPVGASSGGVVVTSAAGLQSNPAAFTVTDNLAITSVSPGTGPVGTTVTVIGGGFGSTQGSNTLSFNGISATVTSWSENQIIATVPPGTSTGPLNVTLGGGGIAWSATSFVVTTTVQVADSFNNTSSYTSEMLGGTWVWSQATGSGCSSCTVRGNVQDTYDNNGNVLTHTDELGHVTTYTYDSNNNLASASQQLDVSHTATTSYTYNSFGEPLTVTDPLGNVTTNTYDANGNLLTVTTPRPDANTSASVTTFAYNSLGELTQITDPLTHVTTLSYTPTGVISTITDAQQNVTTYQYDTHGNRTAVIDALQHTTSFAYDAMDRLTTITYPDTTTSSFGYDSRGRRTSVTDQNGKTTTYAYDDADRLISVTDAATNVTQYAYDTENNLLSITDAANNVTSFAYDPFGRVTKTTFPSTLTETYTYDTAGNLTSKDDRKGQSILYVYDALNRLTHKGYPDSTGVDYVYDLAGKIKQVTDPTGTYGFAYDNMGRLIGTTTQYTFLPGTNFSNSYGYDANSNRTSFTAPDGSTNTYQYDILNRLSTLTSSLTGQFTFGYDALSRRTSLTRPNSVNTSYSYDSLSRLLSVLHQNGTTTLDGATYTYDNAGNRTGKTNQLNNINEQYAYDAIYQLKQVTQGTTTTESYTYDAVGNRLTSLSVPSYTYNSSNELTSTSAATYTYDNNGNTLTKTVSGATTQYAWDFENRLISVALPGTGGTAAFRYDPFGRRIQKAFTQNSATATTNYVYDEANSIEEADSSGNQLAKYTQSAGIDEPLSGLRSGAISYYEQDGLGSVTSLSSIGGVLANTYTYDSFGNLTASTGTLANPYQYTGRDYDAETGLRYYRARYYDANAGRFISEDPVEFFGGKNFFAYVSNNSVNLVDPIGTFPIPHLGDPIPPIPAPLRYPPVHTPLGDQGCSAEQWAQSPNNCAGPTDPNAPYQGPDGLWYNIPRSNLGNPAPDDGPSQSAPPASESSPPCSCLSNPQYVAGYYAIIAQADPKHLKTFAIMAGISGANTSAEHLAEHAGAHWFSNWVSPGVEAVDIYHAAVENLQIENEVEEQIEALKKKVGCK